METTLFLALLKGGAKPDFAAKTFATALVEQSDEDDEISWQIAANFIKDCFAAINFKLQITAEDVQNRLSNFTWPIDEMKRYVFLYDKLPFKQFEQFLYKLCLRIQSLTEESAHAQSTIASTLCSPIEWFMQLIAIWDKTCQQLRSQAITKFFNEPIARIDYQLLRGFQTLRKSYRDDFPILDSICGRLLESVLRGILYPDTHVMMISGLTTMLHDDFHLFYRQLDSTANFYETILTANLAKPFHNNIYKSLFKLLDTYCLNYEDLNEESDDLHRQRSLDVSNFLINSNMLDIYYFYLTKESNKIVLISLLNFLILLQSKLVDPNCFLDTFMEVVLTLVLNANDKIGDISAKFYITVMKRRANDDFICTQCIEFYFAHMNAPDRLFDYVKRIWKYFGIAQNMDIFVEPIAHGDKGNEKCRVWGAHFLCALVQYMVQDYAAHRLKLIQLLSEILQYLQPMKCLVTQTILLDIFDLPDKTEIPNIETDLKEVNQLFEDCAEEKFLSLENWQYPLQKKWFQFFKKSVNFSGHLDRLKEAALIVSEQCTEIIQELDALVESLNADEAQTYSCALQKLCMVTQMKYYKFNCENEILNILQKNLVTQADPNNKSIFQKRADDFNMLIDVYAVELYTVALVQAFDEQDLGKREWFKKRVNELESLLKAWLQHTELVTKQPIIRIKTYFNCLLGLYITFGSSPKDSILSLNVSTYALLVRTLLHVLFKTKGRKLTFNEYFEYTEVHPLRSLAYGRSMIDSFSLLHALPYVEINDHYAWQICLYYALPTAANFKKALHELLLNLWYHKFNIYKRILPIVVYNLHKQQPPLPAKSIMNAIKAHKSFIDNLDFVDRGLLSCHVVFEIIEMIKEALKVRTITGDRLTPLKHLPIFLKNLELGAEIEAELQQEVANLRRSSLRVSERKTLADFLGVVKQTGAEIVSTQGTPRRLQN